MKNKSLKIFLNNFRLHFPLILVSALIFNQSSQQAVIISYDGTWNFFYHKLAHVLVYSILFITSLRSFRNYQNAIIFGILYAISDEIHQTFVPTRTGSVYDVLLDTFAIFLTFLLIWRFKKYLPNFFRKFIRI
jgi:VanZ family protein